MFKLNISQKFFLAIFISMFVMVMIMVLFVNLSFRNGFADYLHQGELTKVKQFIQVLSKEYGDHDDWEFVRNSPREWDRLIVQVKDMRPPNPPKKHRSPRPFKDDDVATKPLFRPPPSHHADFSRGNPPKPLGERIVLLDIDKQWVIGQRYHTTPTSILEIKQGDVIIGWIAVWQGLSTLNKMADKFYEQQFRYFYWMAISALLIAIIASLLLARQFMQPIKALSRGSKKWSSGDLSSRIKVKNQDELGEMAESFNLLAQTLEKNERQRKQWLVDIAHELRTPILVLRSEVEAMLDGIRKLEPRRISSLHTEILSLGTLVNDVYQLSLSDSIQITKEQDPVDLIQIIKNVAESSHSLLQQKDIKLRLLGTEGTAMMAANQQSLHQLLSNLLGNSFRYTHKKGRVEILVSQVPKMIEIIVQDSAPSVPTESLGLLFDRLYRVEQSRSRALGGSGLGLSICATIVASHNGTIIAEHSPLGGVLIKIQFPQINKKNKK
ncbi:MAG: HAMP domain-containing protein [Methylococcales bacterium]|nr:HAMP domain-containing protein [Methylococcales bacterium]